MSVIRILIGRAHRAYRGVFSVVFIDAGNRERNVCGGGGRRHMHRKDEG